MENKANDRVLHDYEGYALECPSCGAPSNGMRRCQWCGSAIPYVRPREKTVIVQETAPRNQTIDNLAKGFSNVVYTISGLKI
jgi:hypothetical protein